MTASVFGADSDSLCALSASLCAHSLLHLSPVPFLSQSPQETDMLLFQTKPYISFYL